MRLYADENFPFPVVERLSQLGYDVITALDMGHAGQGLSDEAVLTLNRKHFIRLHAAASNHSGIIVCTFDPNFDAQANRIHQTISGQSSLDGQLIRINRPNP
jgi:hypothetical protein